ncbi:MAG: hypothetical protein WC100_05875 [Sterolibacterium sp.]
MSGVLEFIEEVAGFYFRSILLPESGMAITQHVHDYDHATLVGSGKAALYADGEHIGDFSAGEACEVKANTNHLFVSLEPNTRLTCIHSVESANSIKEKGI